MMKFTFEKVRGLPPFSWQLFHSWYSSFSKAHTIFRCFMLRYVADVATFLALFLLLSRSFDGRLGIETQRRRTNRFHFTYTPSRPQRCYIFSIFSFFVFVHRRERKKHIRTEVARMSFSINAITCASIRTPILFLCILLLLRINMLLHTYSFLDV